MSQLPYDITADTIVDNGHLQADFINLENRIAPGENFAQNTSACTGFTWAYQSGRVRLPNGTVITRAAGNITLNPSTTNYVECDPTGTVVVNTARSLANKPIRQLVTDTGGVLLGLSSAVNNIDERAGFDFLIPIAAQTAKTTTSTSDVVPIYDATNGVRKITLANLFAALITNPMTQIGDMISAGAAGVATRLAGNTTSTRKFLISQGTGSAATAPFYDVLKSADLPIISLGAQTIGTSASTIAHGLGHTPDQVYIRPTSAGTIWESSTADATNIYLTASATGTTAIVYAR